MRNALFISMTMLAGAVPVSADQAVMRPSPAAQFGGLRPPESDPYSRLFEVRSALKQAQSERAREAPKKTIVCGMTIIDADPSFDPKMRATPQNRTDVRYTVRAVDPPVCGPTRK